jgi:cell division cycle 2-like
MALKRIKFEGSMFRREGFPMTSVREINILLTMDHPNIVNVSEVVTSKNKSGLMDVYMVMEYVQLDLKKFLDTYKAKLKVGEVRTHWSLLRQC